MNKYTIHKYMYTCTMLCKMEVEIPDDFALNLNWTHPHIEDSFRTGT